MWYSRHYSIYYYTNCGTNLQYDQFKSTTRSYYSIQIYSRSYYSISEKQRRSNHKCCQNAKPRNKINMGAWDEISFPNLVQISFKAAEEYLQLLFTTLITP